MARAIQNVRGTKPVVSRRSSTIAIVAIVSAVPAAPFMWVSS